MAYSPEVIKKVKDDFNKKRKAAQTLADMRRAELYSMLPDIEDIDKVIASTGLRVYEAALKGGDIGASIKKLRAEFEALRALRKSMLEAAKIPADYSDVKYECPMCGDTGYVGIEPCECFKKALVKEAFLSAGLGSVLKDQSFSNFSLDLYSDEKGANGKSPRDTMSYILKETKKYAETFKNRKKHDNLFFYGATGLGKTHISTAVARRVIEDGADVVYDSAQNIMQTFEAKTFSNDHGADTKKYTSSDLLIIDDLGAEFKNSFTLSVLYNILNTRICAGKPMIISTNFDSLESISKAYDSRISSRLVGEFRAFMFVGNDIRLEKKAKPSGK